MNTERMSKQSLHYQARGQRPIRHPVKDERKIWDCNKPSDLKL